MFEPEISPCKSEFPDIEIKRQIIGHYLKDICHLTQQNGIYTIEISTPRTLHGKYVIQTDDIDLEFSKVFTEYIKNIQYQNSQRANSIFTNEVFAIIYSYLSILKRTEAQIFTNNDVSQSTKRDLQKILARFTIDYFTHNIDLIEQARKTFKPQSTNDDTVIAEQSDYVWDPDWSHPAFLNFPADISSQAISTISFHEDYVKIIPLRIDANTFKL